MTKWARTWTGNRYHALTQERRAVCNDYLEMALVMGDNGIIDPDENLKCKTCLKCLKLKEAWRPRDDDSEQE